MRNGGIIITIIITIIILISDVKLRGLTCIFPKLIHIPATYFLISFRVNILLPLPRLLPTLAPHQLSTSSSQVPSCPLSIIIIFTNFISPRILSPTFSRDRSLVHHHHLHSFISSSCRGDNLICIIISLSPCCTHHLLTLLFNRSTIILSSLIIIDHQQLLLLLVLFVLSSTRHHHHRTSPSSASFLHLQVVVTFFSMLLCIPFSRKDQQISRPRLVNQTLTAVPSSSLLC